MFEIFYHLGISIHLSKRYSNANIKKVLLLDKKSVAGLPQYVLLDAIGKPHISFGSCIMPIPNKILDEGLNFLFNNYTC